MCFVNLHPGHTPLNYTWRSFATFFFLFLFPALFRPVLACAYGVLHIDFKFYLMVTPGISWKLVGSCPVPSVVFYDDFL